MNLQDLFPTASIQLNIALAELGQWWQRKDAVWPPGMKELMADWVGYSVSLADLTRPQIKFFLRSAPGLHDLGALLPDAIAGIPIVAEESIIFRALQQPGGSLAAPQLRPGARLTVEAQGTSPAEGTLGAFLKDEQGNTYILSANHVLALNGGFGPTQVKAGGTVVSDSVRFVRMSSTSNNQVDAAIAACRGPLPIQAAVPGLPMHRSTTSGPVAPGSVIQKLSSNAGTATASFDSFYQHVLINIDTCQMPLTNFLGMLGVSNNGTGPFSAPGDSGTLAVSGSAQNREPFGLIIANGGPPEDPAKYTIITPFDQVISALEQETHLTLTLMI